MKDLLDFVGLSTEDKPINDLIKDGSTFYTVDTQELYVFYKGKWYNQTNPEENEDDTDDTEPTKKSIEEIDETSNPEENEDDTEPTKKSIEEIDETSNNEEMR